MITLPDASLNDVYLTLAAHQRLSLHSCMVNGGSRFGSLEYFFFHRPTYIFPLFILQLSTKHFFTYFSQEISRILALMSLLWKDRPLPSSSPRDFNGVIICLDIPFADFVEQYPVYTQMDLLVRICGAMQTGLSWHIL